MPPPSERPASPRRRSGEAALKDSPFANVRELHASERRLGEQITKLGDSLTRAFKDAIADSDRKHADEHADMKRVGDERHGPIDTWMQRLKREDEDDAIERARAQGARSMLLTAWRVVAVLDDHWRIVLLAVGLLLALLGALPHVTIGALAGDPPGPSPS